MSRLKVAVVGAGAIGRLHAELIAGDDLTGLAGIADPSDTAMRLAQRLGVRWFRDHRELLDAVAVEAAIIATPNATHLPVARDFIERGVPLMVEKPIASTVEEALALTKAAEDAGVAVLVGHHRRHNPIIQAARLAIGEGQIGKLISASILYTLFKPPEYFDVAWRRETGGGPILINLIHEIDLVRFVCGEIASVQAMTSNETRGFAVEDTAAVILRLVNGALVTLSLTDTVVAPWSWDLVARENPGYPPQPAPLNTHYISGTEGSLTLPQLELWRYRSQKDRRLPISRATLAHVPGDPFRQQLHHLVRVVRGQQQPLVTAADGTRTLAATLAVHDAARTGQAVRIRNAPTMDDRHAQFTAE